MKSRPILFSTAMVKALLAGDKTQTRRTAKLVTSLPDGKGWTCLQKPGTQVCLPLVDGQWQWKPAAGDEYRPYPNIAEYCPYGQPGDQLWVRESFAVQPELWAMSHEQQPIHYLADTAPAQIEDYTGKPSIHMPQWASRLTLELTSVRIERLNDISEEDAGAEGGGFLLARHEYLDGNPDQYRQWYRILWDQINGPGSWAANPYVWALEFKVL